MGGASGSVQVRGKEGPSPRNPVSRDQEIQSRASRQYRNRPEEGNPQTFGYLLHVIVVQSLAAGYLRNEFRASHPMRILIVDDHRAVADAFALALTREHTAVGVVSDFRQVEDWLSDHAVDVVLLDGTLPGCNLFDLIRAVWRRNS